MSPRSSSTRRPSLRIIGVIDIGTNSVKLGVGSVENGRVAHHHAAREPTRIGRGMARSGMMGSRAIQRTAAAVKRLGEDARRHGATDVIAVGTYAFRAARNGNAVARAIARRAGIPVRILTGAEEASMVLRAVRARIRRPRRHLMVFDIGGGSAELVLARGGRTLFSRSVPLGAVNLTERYLTRDRISPAEYRRLNAAIEGVAAPLFARLPRLDPSTVDLVVSGGTATTAADMLDLEFGGDGCSVSTATLRALQERCLAATIAERRNFHGLLPDRADIMPAGLAVLLCLVRHAHKRSLRIVEGGVRDGVMLEWAENARRLPRRSQSRAHAKAAAQKGR
jgi:exopolyphosphatase/guanosine-5'-triphosphate,3'-diphosphate pyrophosphatase